MARTDIGPKIGIDGEAEFRKEITNLSQQVRTFGAELKALSSSADDESDSVANAAQRQELLGKAVDAQKKKLEQMQTVLEAATKKFKDSDTNVLKYRESVAKAETELNQLESQLKDTTQQLDKTDKEAGDLGDTLGNAGKSASSFGDMLKANLSASAITGAIGSVGDIISGLVSSLGDMVEESKEYLKIMGSLEVSSEKAGYSAEETSAAYNELFGVLADNQTAATTTANLQALGLEQDKLNQLIDGTIGAWATYGDSIPIDGLAEAINETVQTGQVTGTLADMLNWAGTSEDSFNESLGKAATESERANLILQEMANQGLVAAGTSWQEQNASLVAANQATAEYQANAAALSEAIMPMFTAIQQAGSTLLGVLADIAASFDFTAIGEQINSLTEWFIGLVDSVQSGEMTIGEALGKIIEKFGETIGDILSNLGDALPDILQAGIDIVMNLLQGIVDSMPELLQGVADLLSGALKSIAENLPDFLQKGVEMIGSLIDGVRESWPQMIETAAEAVADFAAEIVQNLPQIIQAGFELLGKLIEGMINSIPRIPVAIAKIITAIKDKFLNTNWLDVGKNILSGIIDGIASMVGSAVSAVGNAVSSIKNAFTSKKRGFDTHSPSKWARDQIGKNVVLGLADGLTQNAYRAVDAAKAASKGIKGAFDSNVYVPKYSNGTAAAYNNLAASMGNLTVVLNDGTLVGKIAPKIDATLGGYTKIKGRYGV